MSTWLTVIQFVAGLVVVAEAMNKLERTDIFAGGLSLRARVTVVLKALAWALLAVGGGGAVATPVLGLYPPPGLHQVCVILGFAVLIVRTRVKEG